MRYTAVPLWLPAAKVGEAALVLLLEGTCFSKGNTAANSAKLSKVQTSLAEG